MMMQKEVTMVEQKHKVLVFLEQKSLRPAGGPAAVGYYYLKEKERRADNSFSFLEDLNTNNSLHEKESSLFSKMPPIVEKVYSFVKSVVKWNIFLGGKYPITPFLDYEKYDVIHFHDTRSLYERRYELRDYKGIVLLQSHSPQPLGHELMDYKIPRLVKFFIPRMKKRFEEMDKYAFERADYIIFPCPDAEEPYYNNWPYYKVIHEHKAASYKYILTGIPAAIPKRRREEVREELHISNKDFIVSYVGRHNEIKGYDSLKRFGVKFLRQNENTWIVCAGKEDPLKRPNNSRWIEIGWTKDAHSYISAADVFVLPNKETYFDIVMLELLSLGQVVIASKTGGNKYFETNHCEGVLLYNTEEEAIDLLNRVKQMTREERKLLGQKNKEFFERNHTVSKMYDSYLSLLKEI